MKTKEIIPWIVAMVCAVLSMASTLILYNEAKALRAERCAIVQCEVKAE